jgi:hypothetical protein
MTKQSHIRDRRAAQTFHVCLLAKTMFYNLPREGNRRET